MRPSHLRIYSGPADDSNGVALSDAKPSRETVSVPLSAVFPLLSDAVHSQRTWLRDFEEDEITVSMDLYEVILAYQHYRRPSA